MYMKGLKVRQRQHHYLCVKFVEKSLRASEYSFYFEAFVMRSPPFCVEHNIVLDTKKWEKEKLRVDA